MVAFARSVCDSPLLHHVSSPVCTILSWTLFSCINLKSSQNFRANRRWIRFCHEKTGERYFEKTQRLGRWDETMFWTMRHPSDRWETTFLNGNIQSGLLGRNYCLAASGNYWTKQLVLVWSGICPSRFWNFGDWTCGYFNRNISRILLRFCVTDKYYDEYTDLLINSRWNYPAIKFFEICVHQCLIYAFLPFQPWQHREI